MKKWLLSVLHNCVVHPMMPFVPTAVMGKVHDVTAKWAFSDTNDE